MGFGSEMIAVAWITVAVGGTILTLGLYFTNGFSQLTQAGVIGCVGLWTLGLGLLIANKIIDRPTVSEEKKQ